LNFFHTNIYDFSQFQKIAETRRQRFFFKEPQGNPVGDFHIDTIEVERKNRKVSEPAKKKSQEKFSLIRRE